MVFDAYSQFEESLITALIERQAQQQAAADLAAAESGGASAEASKAAAATTLELDMRLERLERLMERRPELLSSVLPRQTVSLGAAGHLIEHESCVTKVLLRQNPHSVHEWLKRASLFEASPAKAIQTYAAAVKTARPHHPRRAGPLPCTLHDGVSAPCCRSTRAAPSVGPPPSGSGSQSSTSHTATSRMRAPSSARRGPAETQPRPSRDPAERLPRGCREAAEREPRGCREAAERLPRGADVAAGGALVFTSPPPSALRPQATLVPYKSVDELASIWMGWSEMELRHKKYPEALAVLAEATAVPPASRRAKEKEGPVQDRLYKFTKLWAFYADLQESLAGFEPTRVTYDKMIELRIVTPQLVLNYAAFLEEHKHFELAFQAHRRSREQLAAAAAAAAQLAAASSS